MTFAGEGVQIETVGSGEAAVQRASESPPDLVIADSSMSMSGYDVSQAIKGNAATAQAAVIVLASQHHPFDSAKAREAGVDDHILKPFDSQAMIDKAKEVLSRPRAVAAAAAHPASPPAHPVPLAPPSARAPGAGRPAESSPPHPVRSTVSFGSVDRPVLQLAEEEPTPLRTPAKVPLRPPNRPATPAARAPAAPVAATPARAAVAAATAPAGSMADKLADLGLTQEQIEGVLGLSRDVIERVVWEVVPDLAEVIIKEEIRRLTAD